MTKAEPPNDTGTADESVSGPDTGIDQLLQRLTLEEKLQLCAGKGFWKTRPVKRLGLRSMGMTDGPHGVAFHSSFRRATRFPAEIALAACWNPALAEAFGIALGAETRAAGKQVVLAPGVNICRTPLNGRTFEYFTEDPYLNSRLAVAVVRGVQSQGVAACVKHFAANNQELNRMTVDVRIGERALREIYLPAFEAAVREAGAEMVMACYNKVNGEHGCENRYLLKDILRDEWGFKGTVVSDWFAARNTRSTRSCVEGGLNLEMPGTGARRLTAKALQRALAAGEISEAQIDANLRGLLYTLVRTGCDRPAETPVEPDREEHARLARRIATESLVLLKNDNALLPLDTSVRKRIAVVGKHATRHFTGPLKGGSSGVWPRYAVTPLQALRRHLGDAQIVKDPATADAALVFAGLGHRPGQDCEHFDRRELELPAEQIDLIRQTAAQNPNTVVVLISGSPIAMDAWLHEVSAVLVAWYGGQEAGNAIADVLLGAANPAGRLPVTFPRRLEDCSAHRSPRTYPGDAEVHYEEGVMVGYRHFDSRGIEPLFPFGHGLSYTRFDYSDLQLSEDRWHGDAPLTVSFTLRNTGERAGAEIAQLYVGESEPRVERPPQELKGFARVQLAPGEERRVEIALRREQLAYYDESEKRWRVDAGQYEIFIGASSRDIRLRATVEIC